VRRHGDLRRQPPVARRPESKVVIHFFIKHRFAVHVNSFIARLPLYASTQRHARSSLSAQWLLRAQKRGICTTDSVAIGLHCSRRTAKISSTLPWRCVGTGQQHKILSAPRTAQYGRF
jgi:hypothetical protein